MKVKELIKILSEVDGEENVFVAVEKEKSKYTFQVSQPIVPIDHAYSGFDWDHGKFILVPRHKVLLPKTEIINTHL